MASQRQRRRRRRFSRALRSDKCYGLFAERHSTGMQTRHAPQPQQEPENWPQQIDAGVFDGQMLGPSRPDFGSFSIQPELGSVRVRQPAKIAAANSPHFESWFAGLIL